MFINHTEKKEMTWAEIKAAADAGTIRELLSSGDRIPVTLKTGEEIELDITYDENGKCYFVTHDCLDGVYYMNARATNKGGWAASAMRSHLNGPVFESLPDELREIIVPTKIVQILAGERVECEDKLFCLSYTQVVGNDWPDMNRTEPEETHLDIFPTERSRVKECGDNGTWWYWLRSPVSSSSSSFLYVNGGSGSNGAASNANGVSFGFCLNQ